MLGQEEREDERRTTRRILFPEPEIRFGKKHPPVRNQVTAKHCMVS